MYDDKAARFLQENSFWIQRKCWSVILFTFTSGACLSSVIGLKNPNGAPNVSVIKAPKTIHRCILKTAASTKGSGEGRLSCHVCLVSYEDYESYFHHLVNNMCVRQPKVDKIVFNTSMSIYAPHTTAEVGKY